MRWRAPLGKGMLQVPGLLSTWGQTMMGLEMGRHPADEECRFRSFAMSMGCCELQHQHGRPGMRCKCRKEKVSGAASHYVAVVKTRRCGR